MPLQEFEIDPAGFAKLSWVAVASLADGPDPDDVPDIQAAEGKLIVTPSVYSIAYPNADPKYTRLLTKRQINVIEGQVSHQGNNYVKLEANVPGMVPATVTWTVQFSIGVGGVPIRIPDLRLQLEAGVDIDLSDYINQ